jgi:hypothetical protein
MKTKFCNSDFEKLIFATVGASHVVAVSKYMLTSDGQAECRRVFSTAFYKAWASVFPGVQPSQQLPNIGNMFEVDLFLIASTNMSLKSVMLDVVERDDKTNVHSINGHNFEDMVINSGESIHFEITADIDLLPKKIHQVERALQLHKTCFPSIPRPAACGVIVTGYMDQFAKAVGSIQKGKWGSDDAPMVFNVPFFIIFSPFRNIYTDVSEVKMGITDLKKDISGLTSLLSIGMTWSSMTEQELKIECKNKGLLFMDEMPTLPRHTLVTLLIHNAQRPGTCGVF